MYMFFKFLCVFENLCGHKEIFFSSLEQNIIKFFSYLPDLYELFS